MRLWPIWCGNVRFSKDLHEILRKHAFRTVAVSYSWTRSSELDVKRFFDGICSDTSRNSFQTAKFYPLRLFKRLTGDSARAVAVPCCCMVSSKPNVKHFMHGICSNTSRNSFRTKKFYPIRRNERPASVSERTVDLRIVQLYHTSSSRAYSLAGRVHETPGPDGGKAIQRGLRICSTVTVTGCGLQFLATSSRVCGTSGARTRPSETSFLQRILSPSRKKQARTGWQQCITSKSPTVDKLPRIEEKLAEIRAVCGIPDDHLPER